MQRATPVPDILWKIVTQLIKDGKNCSNVDGKKHSENLPIGKMALEP